MNINWQEYKNLYTRRIRQRIIDTSYEEYLEKLVDCEVTNFDEDNSYIRSKNLDQLQINFDDIMFGYLFLEKAKKWNTLISDNITILENPKIYSNCTIVDNFKFINDKSKFKYYLGASNGNEIYLPFEIYKEVIENQNFKPTVQTYYSCNN
jgi:hypothetical protein